MKKESIYKAPSVKVIELQAGTGVCLNTSQDPDAGIERLEEEEFVW